MSPRDSGPEAPDFLASPRRRLSSFVFSTDGMPTEERYDQMRAHVDGVNDLDIDPPARRRIDARGECWGLGAMLVSSYRTPALRITRTRAHVARDGLDHILLRVLRSGSSMTTAGLANYEASPGRVVLEDLAAPYCDEWSAAEWVTLSISRSADPQLCSGLEALGVGPVAGIGAMLLADYLLALAQRLSYADPSEERMLTETSRAMVAGCLLTQAAPRLVTMQDRSHVARSKAERVIRRNIASARLDAERIAALAGVSRSTLYRLFERDGGVANYVLSLRLEIVAAELRDPSRADDSIAALAERWGLFCPASFSRAFRKAYGCTPSDARAGALLGVPVRPKRPSPLRGTLTLAALLAAKQGAITSANSQDVR